MKQEDKDLPLSMVTLIFGALSIPLAFARHLVSLSVVLGVLAIVFGLWGRTHYTKHFIRYTNMSNTRSKLGFKLAVVGTMCAVVMWVLWARNVLL